MEKTIPNEIVGTTDFGYATQQHIPTDAANSLPQVNLHPSYHNQMANFINDIMAKLKVRIPTKRALWQVLSKSGTEADQIAFRDVRQTRNGGTPGMTLQRVGSGSNWDWRPPAGAADAIAAAKVDHWWVVDTAVPRDKLEGRNGDVWMVVVTDTNPALSEEGDSNGS